MLTQLSEKREKREKQMDYDLATAPYVGDPDTCLTNHQSNGCGMFLQPGELRATYAFFDDEIECGRKYTVRAIDNPKYPTFTGYLSNIGYNYHRSLAFDDVHYIASDGSTTPVKKGDLAAIFPKEGVFSIYTDGAPFGYALLDTG